MLMAAIYVAARWLNLPRQPRAPFGEILAAPGCDLGPAAGRDHHGRHLRRIFTPTEAAAVAAVYAFIVAVFVYRDMGPLARPAWLRGLHSTSRASNPAGPPTPRPPRVHRKCATSWSTGRTTIMLMFIIANAMLFAHVLTTERIPHVITEWIVAAGFEPWSFLIVVNILLLIAGNFMEPSAILLIMAPILFPIAMQLGIDPVHLGIIMVVNMEIGLITPPVGLNLFVTSGITNMTVLEVVLAALPWLGILLIFLILITYVPAISTFLPNLLYG